MDLRDHEDLKDVLQYIYLLYITNIYVRVLAIAFNKGQCFINLMKIQGPSILTFWTYLDWESFGRDQLNHDLLLKLSILLIQLCFPVAAIAGNLGRQMEFVPHHSHPDAHLKLCGCWCERWFLTTLGSLCLVCTARLTSTPTCTSRIASTSTPTSAWSSSWTESMSVSWMDSSVLPTLLILRTGNAWSHGTGSFGFIKELFPGISFF